MSIKALSPKATNHNTFQKTLHSNSKHNKDLTKNASSFELPSYKVSFGMARIDLEKLKKNHDINVKYFTPDERGNIPAFNMDAEELKRTLCELNQEEDNGGYRLLNTINHNNGRTIVHSADPQKQKVVHDELNKYPNKSIAYTDLYIKQDKDGFLPAHTFNDTENISLMAEGLASPMMLRRVFTTETNDSKELPSHLYGSVYNDSMQTEVIKTFENDKETLKSIFLHANADGDYPMLPGAESIQEFLNVFKDDYDVLDSYFFKEPENAEDDEKRIIRAFLDYSSDDCKDYLDIIHKELINSNPKILKELYTLKCTDNEPLADGYKQAKRVFELITDSDLNEKDSLEVLQKNRDLLEEYNLENENYDLIESYLEDAAESNCQK